MGLNIGVVEYLQGLNIEGCICRGYRLREWNINKVCYMQGRSYEGCVFAGFGYSGVNICRLQGERVERDKVCKRVGRI